MARYNARLFVEDIDGRSWLRDIGGVDFELVPGAKLEDAIAQLCGHPVKANPPGFLCARVSPACGVPSGEEGARQIQSFFAAA